MIWPQAKLKFVARFGYGDALPTDEAQDGPFKVFGSNGPFASFSRANTGAPAIVVGRKGSYGKVNWTEDRCYASDTTFFVDESTSRNHLRWVYWLLQTLRLDEGTDEAAVPGLSRESAYSRDVPIPPPAKQRVIADYLDRETARLDALVAAKERVLGLLAEKRRALITRAVTRGLDPHAPLRDSGIPWLGKIPAHWDIVPLKWLTQPDRPIMYGIVLPGPDVSDGCPILKGGNVRPSRMNLASLARTTPEIEAPYARARLRANDLVYSIRGSICDCEIVPRELEGCNITQDVARVAPRADVYESWLRYVLICTPIREELAAGSLGAAVRGINIFDLKRVRIPTPSPTEQELLVARLDKALIKLNRLAESAEQTVSLIKERHAALIAAAVTGQIDVRAAP